MASSQRPIVPSWQQLLEPAQDIHAFLLPCHSSAQQLHGHLYIICYAGCVDQCCWALPIHTSPTNACTCHSICRPQLNVQECQCRLCSSRMCPLSVMYVHTACGHIWMLVMLFNWSFMMDAPQSVPANDHRGFQMEKLIVSVWTWSFSMSLKWVNLQTVDSSCPAVVMASTNIAFFPGADQLVDTCS